MASGIFARAAIAARRTTPGTISTIPQPIRWRKTSIEYQHRTPGNKTDPFHPLSAVSARRQTSFQTAFSAPSAPHREMATTYSVCSSRSRTTTAPDYRPLTTGGRITECPASRKLRCADGYHRARLARCLMRIIYRSCCLLYRHVQRPVQTRDKHRRPDSRFSLFATASLKRPPRCAAAYESPSEIHH